ncbi:MAG TPA: hypothetical protein VN476_17060 [Pyrinomonadaceae bacterium]|nr:hypothetical protein [Pyrinomonadaceae bacterium]
MSNTFSAKNDNRIPELHAESNLPENVDRRIFSSTTPSFARRQRRPERFG